MPSTSEDVIRRTFADLGGSVSCVERVKKMKDYAFVHFVNRDSAEKAIRAAQNLTVEGSKIEVSW
jgi:RNA recognition motif-containing protein